MSPQPTKSYTAFAGSRRVASGDLADVALKAKKALQEDGKATVLIFDDETSRQAEVDFRGTPEAVARRIEAAAEAHADEAGRKAGPGRPKLGVVAREVTLLPQQWEWLASQPGGASVTLRKVVEEARKRSAPKDRARQAQEAAYRFMTVMAGDLPGFEEALRALYAKDEEALEKRVKAWPKDIREHSLRLARASFGKPAAGSD